MKKAPYHILRVGTGVMFGWIGVLILREPEVWGSLVQPWVLDLLPFGLREAMLSTAVLDIVIGFLLLIDYYVWVAGALGSFHLLTVLITVGINSVTVRDIGLVAAALALLAFDWPLKKKSNSSKLGLSKSVVDDKID